VHTSLNKDGYGKLAFSINISFYFETIQSVTTLRPTLYNGRRLGSSMSSGASSNDLERPQPTF